MNTITLDFEKLAEQWLFRSSTTQKKNIEAH